MTCSTVAGIDLAMKRLMKINYDIDDWSVYCL